MHNSVQNYIAGSFGVLDMDRLIYFAKKAGLNFITAHTICAEDSRKTHNGIIYPNLGLVFLTASKRQVNLLFPSNGSSPLHFIEQEVDYFPLQNEADLNQTQSTPDLNWGVKSTQAHKSIYTGKGVRVALLDTGIDSNHPDFSKANITKKSFIEGENSQDGNGHGTHCAGIIIGPKKPNSTMRYGISPEVELFSGKVLKNSGAAHSRYVFQGIEWAIQNKCKIISISLGNRVRKGVSYSLSFEKAAQAAAKKGALIIASAGNDSFRHLQRLLPVSGPANCPSIMAVGAINEANEMYNRSNSSININGGIVDLVGPGVAIQSSYTNLQPYKKLSGTSMATSFVTAIAAQYMQAYPNKQPDEIRMLLKQNARPLPISSKDAGAGLVQCL